LLAEYGIASELLDRQAISALEPISCRSIKWACCTRRPPRSIHRARWSRPMRGCSRMPAAMSGKRRQGDRARRRSLARGAGG
jgi:hypothetical protein